MGPIAPISNMQCFTFSEGTIQKDSPNVEYYGDDLENIKKLAKETKNGKFTYGDYYFIVASETTNTGTTYAVYDRTSHHKDLADRALQSTLLLCLAIIIVGIIAYFLSAKIVKPVEDAMNKQKDLIANASHELKTPLTVISTNLDVIKSEPESTVTDNNNEIEAIGSQITRMQGLIQNMLELSRLEQTEIPKEKINLSSIVEGACLQFEAVCFEQGTSLVSDIQPNITIMGDKNSIERLIIILLDNANKYSGNNGKIGIKLSQEGKKIHLSAMNTGSVISKEEATHVFDRFYRSDGARENKDKQSFGLGLSIAHATVDNHGGTISCHGIEGKGTVFDVYFPIIKNKKKS